MIAALMMAFTSCKSEFERIRTSGDVKAIYEKAEAYYAEEEYQKAQTLYELIIGSYRGRKEAEDIYYKYAYTYYHLGRYILAAYYFKNFSSTYSTSDYREEIDFMAAYSYYELSPNYRLDQSYTSKAIDDFQLFVNTYPQSERVTQCNRLIDEMRLKLEKKAFEGAKLYYDLRQYQAAIQTFENVLKDFPETGNIEEIRYMIIRSSYELAENSVVDKQRERYTDVIKETSEFAKRYSDSRFLKEVNNLREKAEDKLNTMPKFGSDS
ncbi:MAG: outer membrane protein assembly factor BamD [Saprospiraceae bacterium]|nr:outer membrane protein assembly factor BamD [Saprospiraceae bacterium]